MLPGKTSRSHKQSIFTVCHCVTYYYYYKEVFEVTKTPGASQIISRRLTLKSHMKNNQCGGFLHFHFNIQDFYTYGFLGKMHLFYPTNYNNLHRFFPKKGSHVTTCVLVECLYKVHTNLTCNIKG